jgi:hypothetical protein
LNCSGTSLGTSEKASYRQLTRPKRPFFRRTISAFGDFDPSGEYMPTSLVARLRSFYGCEPTIERVAILKEDISLYNLPPDFAKRSDSRTKGFIAHFGDEAVELDALPVNVLRARLVESVQAHMNLKR